MLYGKWRPRGFDEVVGQDHIITTLRNALATSQVAHAYLFSGPRGQLRSTPGGRAVQRLPRLRSHSPRQRA